MRMRRDADRRSDTDTDMGPLCSKHKCQTSASYRSLCWRVIYNQSHLPRISWSPDLQSVSPAQDLLRRIERHRKASDKKVRKCQADEEVVVDAPQLGVEDDAEDDEEVGEDGDHDDKYQDDPLDDGREVQCEMSQLMVCCIF